MEFVYLDQESEELLQKLNQNSDLPKNTVRGTTIDHLVKMDYVIGKNVTTLSDVGPCYLVLGITQKGKTYFEMKKKYEKEQKKLSRREWKVAIISALVGAVIGIMPSIVQWLFK